MSPWVQGGEGCVCMYVWEVRGFGKVLATVPFLHTNTHTYYSLLPETKELATMNNYFGIGLDAKITYQFNTTREKNPAQYK